MPSSLPVVHFRMLRAEPPWTERYPVFHPRSWLTDGPAYVVDGYAAGVNLIAGASNVESAWTQLIAPDTLTDVVDLLKISIFQTGRTNTATPTLLDLAVAPAGSEESAIRVSDVACGNLAGSTSGMPKYLWLPIHIPPRARVAFRLQTSDATPSTSHTRWSVYKLPYGRSPDILETLGLANGATSRGALLSANDTYVEVGISTRDYQAMHVSFSGSNDSSFAAQTGVLTIAAGAKVGSEVVLKSIDHIETTNEITQVGQPYSLIPGPFPAGTRFWAKDSGATNNLVDVVLHGVPWVDP